MNTGQSWQFGPGSTSTQLPSMAKKLRAYRSISDLPFHRLVKGAVGRTLMTLLPAQASMVKSDPFGQKHGAVGKLIRHGWFVKAVAERDHALITRFLGNYWSSQVSDEFYEGLSHRYETLFLAYHSAIVEETRKAMAFCGGPFSQLVEVGSGDGKILNHFSEALVAYIPTFHGIDLNLPQVQNNRKLFAERPSLSFHHADAGRWLREHPLPGTVLVANGGVLEYFTRAEVLELFTFLARNCAPCVISLTESIAADHNLAKEPDTYPYGFELSLSHNYSALLEAAGYTITYTNDRFTTPEESETVGRWLQLVAAVQ